MTVFLNLSTFYFLFYSVRIIKVCGPPGLAISDFVNELYFGDQDSVDSIEHALLLDLEERVDRARRSEEEDREKWGNPEWDLSLGKEKYVG